METSIEKAMRSAKANMEAEGLIINNETQMEVKEEWIKKEEREK